MKHLPILFASLLFSSSVSALPDVAQIPAYEIEILVFKNLQIDDQDNELWVQDIDPGKQPDMADATPVGGGIPAESEIRKISEKMFASGKYLLLTHKRWIQDAVPKTEAQLMRIANAEANLDGTVRFYMGRFLHLEINLTLKEELMPITDTNNAADGSGQNNTEQSNTENFFIIKEQRRIRSVILNYFDHPRFGVLVQVNPVKVSTQ